MIIGLIYISVVISAVYGDEVLMEEHTFCGDNIINTLQKFCREYYTPGKSHPRPHPGEMEGRPVHSPDLTPLDIFFL